jgi:hypothetical protein
MGKSKGAITAGQGSAAVELAHAIGRDSTSGSEGFD